MSFDVDRYLEKLIGECKNAFGARLLYVGLQGSYMRGEANENSDIDVMMMHDSFRLPKEEACRMAYDVGEKLLRTIGIETSGGERS